MQAAKDTFVSFLAAKVAELDPARRATIEGVTRAAVLACENERAEWMEKVEEAFCVDWGAAKGVRRGVQAVECAISYWTRGSDEMSGIDRGRRLTEMDLLLIEALSERSTPKLDLTAVPAAELGSDVFWGPLELEAAEQDGMKLRRSARLKVYYFAEGA